MKFHFLLKSETHQTSFFFTMKLTYCAYLNHIILVVRWSETEKVVIDFKIRPYSRQSECH